MATDGRPMRIYPLGSNTELAATESGKLYIGSVTETGSGASANIGKITTITSTPGAGVYDDVFAAGDYLIIRHQQYGMLGVGQWIKVQSVSSTGASAELTLEDNTAEFYKYLNSSGSAYTGQTSVGITFEKVAGWGVREMTNDQIDDSIVPEVFKRWGSYTKGTATHDGWKGHIKPLAGTSNTADYNLLGTVGERYRSPDVVGDHPVANNVTITNYSLEQCVGTKPFNGAADATHVDDLNSVVEFLGANTGGSHGDKVYEISDAEMAAGPVIARCNTYYTSAANTVGSYHIGTAAGDSDTSSWHDETWYTDTVIASSGTANVAYHLYRKESGIERGWSTSRSLSNANTEARAANSVTHWAGANADYIAVGNYPRAATDEVIFRPIYNQGNNQAKEANTVQAYGHSATLQDTADDAGIHLHWIKHLLIANAGEYLFVSGNTATTTFTLSCNTVASHGTIDVQSPADTSDIVLGMTVTGTPFPSGATINNVVNIETVATATGATQTGTFDLTFSGTAAGTWQFCGNVYDKVTTLLDTIYSQGYEGIYSSAYEGIYSAAYVGIYSQGFTGGYTLTYGSGDESPNPQTSSEGPTYSGTYSQGFEGIYSSNYVGIYSSNYVGIYSNQYTGSTVITTLETDTYSLWKRIG